MKNSLLIFLLFFLATQAAGVGPRGVRPDVISEKFGGVYRRPLENDPSTLDPALMMNIYAYTISQQIFDGLVQFDGDLNVIPAIADFWEGSRDGRTWTFQLKKGVKFHNGREVTAQDFVYSFTRLLDPKVKSPIANLLSDIKGARNFLKGEGEQVDGLKALEKYTLQIELEEPFAPFLSILAMANVKVVPKETVENGIQTRPVGTGPFKFVSWSPNEEVVLQAFEDYHEGRPFLDQVVFKIFPGNPLEKIFEEFSSKRELEESIVPSDKSDEINRDPRYKPYIRLKKPTLSILYLGLNNKLSPFTDKRVRQAFNYAVNREAIVRDITKRGSIVARGILPPGMSAYNPELQGYYYDPAKAKRLLAEAGYPDGKGLPKIELWSGSKAESTLKELDAYKGYFEDIGVNVEVTFAPDSKTFFERLSKGEVPMFRASWFADIPDPDNFLYVLFHSQSKTNRTFYRNEKVDELLTQARKETDYLKRISLYREVEKIVIDDAPWIGQHHHVFEYLFQPYVHGVEINSLGGPYIPMKKIWLDKNARKGS